jgi:glycosyltransferase involved in cell wall biosynthesis
MIENNTKKSIKSRSIRGRVLPDASFVTTVYNEECDIAEFLESLMEQTYLPGEIIIVDGGSKDRTLEKILDFFNIKTSPDGKGTLSEPKRNEAEFDVKTVIGDGKKDGRTINVRIIKKSGANISRGRNEAIANSSGRIICVSDAGCILDKNWMFEITRLYSGGTYNVVGGFNMPHCRKFLQKCLAVCIMPLVEEIRADRYMPSSRNISFKKKVWVDTGGYPEEMDYGEDMKLNFNIKKKGYGIRFNPGAVVYWKMRENLSQISRQFFRYAKGDAAGRMYAHRHLIRFASFLTLIAVLVVAFCLNRWALFVLVPLFMLYVYKPYRRLAREFIRKNGGSCRLNGKEKILAIPAIPFLLLQIDISKMCGYTCGLVRNIRKS